MNTTKQDKSVGEQLRLAREAKGWSLDEVARRTKLKRSCLAALEENAFEKLPSLSNTRGFIRIYARELELDGWSLLKKLNLGVSQESLDMLELHPDDLESIPKRRQPSVATSQGIGLIVVLAVLGIAAVIGLWQLYVIWPDLFPKEKEVALLENQIVQEAQQIAEVKKNEPASGLSAADAPKAQPLKPTNSVNPAMPTPPSVAPALPAAAIPIAPPVAQVEPAPAVREDVATGANKLQLIADGNAAESDRWVRVVGVRAGKEITLFESILPAASVVPSQEQAWVADSFVVTFREASAVEVIYNGTNYGPYPKPGPQRVPMPSQ